MTPFKLLTGHNQPDFATAMPQVRKLQDSMECLRKAEDERAKLVEGVLNPRERERQ